MIGFHEKYYLGLARISNVDPLSLLIVAESEKDSIILYSKLPFGVIMVDCYTGCPGEPFSIIVQGDDLISNLRKCFQKMVPRTVLGSHTPV